MARVDSYDRALTLLARRPHFRREIEEKLGARGYGDSEIESTVERLTASGYLDDRQSAQDFVRSRLARGAVGRRRLAFELGRRGVASEIISDTLQALTPDDDLDQARRAASQWSLSGRKDPAALARHLERKGFSAHAILAILAELEGDTG